MDNATTLDVRNDPAWRRRYFSLWLAMGLYSMVAFRLVDGPAQVWIQGSAFALLFPLILWPLFAASPHIWKHN